MQGDFLWDGVLKWHKDSTSSGSHNESVYMFELYLKLCLKYVKKTQHPQNSCHVLFKK